MPKFFGTDGIRTKAGDFPLTEPALFTIGKVLGELLASRLERSVRAIIGRDTRESGTWIEIALASGLKISGANVVSAGVITTPGVAYLTKSADYDVGIVISASHNPFYDNGIKIFSPSGRKFDEKDEEFIESKLLDSKLASGDYEKHTLNFSPKLSDLYFQFLETEIAKGLNLQRLKIALDCANGAATEIAPRLFSKLGAKVVLLGSNPDGKNINDGCGSLHLDKLKAFVKENGCNLGVAFDGDADRALFVDEQGEIVDGDRTLYIMAEHFLSNNRLNPKAIVATVMSNVGLEIALKALGIELRRTPVGDKYVLEDLINSGALVGGEQSGHIIFPHISLAGDGIITALELLKVLVAKERNLSELSREFQTFPQILLNIKVKSKPSFSSIPAIALATERVEQELAGEGRLLLRYSGTENLARVMIEGKNLTDITRQAEYLAEIIRTNLAE
ncbi:MAG: phosphoglucosamine mutase [Acidobacteria bacterium]|nr:phosphoglucosamine mutase [Acidobacteriota bacterium]